MQGLLRIGDVMEYAKGITKILAAVRQRHRIDRSGVKLNIVVITQITPRYRKRSRRVDTMQPAHPRRDEIRPAPGAAAHVKTLCSRRQCFPWEHMKIRIEKALQFVLCDYGLIKPLPLIAK